MERRSLSNIYPRSELRGRGSPRQLASGGPEAMGGALFPDSWLSAKNDFENIDSRTDNACFSI